MFPARHGIALVVLLVWAAGQAGAAARSGDSPEALLAAARQAYEQKDYARAQKLAERVVSRHADSAAAEEARLVLVDALASQGDHAAAFEQCEKLLAAHPRTRRRSAVLRRELELGKALTESHGTLLVFRYSRLDEGVKVLEKVIEHSPFGPSADDAVFAIAEAYRQHARYEEARDHYARLLKNYRRSPLTRRAIIGRASCNYHLTEGAPYDPKPAEEAAKDFDILARVAGGAKEVVERRDALRDVIAKGRYDAGIFYFRNGNIEAGMRYLQSVIGKYPKSTYAARARRILQEVIIAKFPDTEYAKRARRALAVTTSGAGKSKEKP